MEETTEQEEKKYTFTISTFEKIREICKEKRIFSKQTINIALDMHINWQTIDEVFDYMLEKGYIQVHQVDSREIFEYIEK